jgi:asparagine synthase (glutamine-hydrolysing)
MSHMPPDLLRRLLGRSPATPDVSPLARRIKEARLTYLNDGKLAAIERALRDVTGRDVPGVFIECGIALGGSAILIASSIPADREFHGYDVFGMIPPPTSEHDDDKSRTRYETIRSGRSSGIGGDTYYGYIDNLYDRVVENFTQFGLSVDGRRIALHKGPFEETLHPEGSVAFAHVDCDWYDPVKLCLERIVPRLSPGGHLLLDDYNDYGGCRRATDEFVRDRTDLDVIATAPNFILRRR